MGKRGVRSGLACASAAVVAGASFVGAAATSGATTARTALEQGLAARQQALDTLASQVQGDDRLSAPVRQTLVNQITAETSGIDALAQAVPGEAASQLKASATQMIDQYRVYLVMTPKAHIALRTAHQFYFEQRVQSAEPGVAARITRAKAAGTTVASAQATYQSLVSELHDAATDTGQVDVTAVLAVTPAGFPADGGLLGSARSSLAAAVAQVRQVRRDVRSLRSDLAVRRNVGLHPSGHDGRGASTTTTAPGGAGRASGTGAGGPPTTTALTSTLATLGTFTGPGTATTPPAHGG